MAVSAADAAALCCAAMQRGGVGLWQPAPIVSHPLLVRCHFYSTSLAPFLHSCLYQQVFNQCMSGQLWNQTTVSAGSSQRGRGMADSLLAAAMWCCCRGCLLC